jgi:oligopeptide transport system permease protein
MAEKAIRLGGESTADAIVSAVDAMYTEHTFAEKDFALKHNDDEIAVDTNFAAQNFWKEALIRFFNKKSAVLGLVLIVVIVLLAVLGPGMNSYTYSGQDLSQKNFAPRVPGIEQFGILDGSEKMSTTTGTKVTNAYQEKDKLDVYYWFGSDLYGRDIWTRTWEGARVSLIIAVAAAIIDMVIGMSYGLISGYFGGRVDMVMQRFLEVANGIPRLVIVTLLLLVLQPGMVTIIFALMLTEWVGMSRIARAEMLKLKDQEFVLASRTLGAGSFFIIFKEVLPNIIGPIITQVMFSIRYLYRGVPLLCGSGHPGAAVFAGLSDQRAVQQLHHPPLSDHPAHRGHEPADAQLQPRGGWSARGAGPQDEEYVRRNTPCLKQKKNRSCRCETLISPLRPPQARCTPSAV